MCTVHGDTQGVSWYLHNVCLASGRPGTKSVENDMCRFACDVGSVVRA